MVGQIILHLAAPNTPNGNPNRVLVAIDLYDGRVSAAWREGFAGSGVGEAIPTDWYLSQRGAVARAEFRIPVSASVARDFLKEGQSAMAEKVARAKRQRYSHGGEE
jgi:hypothetical protein